MSDHIDGAAPELARDAAGVRLTDAEAVALAAEVLSDDGLCDAVPTLAAIARYVLAVAPVVAAARALPKDWWAERWEDDDAMGWACQFCKAELSPSAPDGEYACFHRPGCVGDALAAAVRALDGLGGA